MIWSCKLFKLKPAMHIQIAHSIGHPIICYKANPVICITREQRTKPCLSARFTQNLAHFYRTSEISWGGELERPAVQSAWCYTLNLVHVTNLTNPGVFFTTTRTGARNCNFGHFCPTSRENRSAKLAGQLSDLQPIVANEHVPNSASHWCQNCFGVGGMVVGGYVSYRYILELLSWTTTMRS